jgi:nitric oxide reductase subunit B
MIGNQAPAQFPIWSIISVIVLIAAIALFVLIYITQEDVKDVQLVTD